LRPSLTEVPSLCRSYPASSVVRTSPPPQTARPGSRELPVDREPRSPLGLPVLRLIHYVCMPLPLPRQDGLGRETAKRAFDGFLTGKVLTANQIQFVSLVVDYLTQAGWMSPSQLYESPFTDFSPRGVEGVFDSPQVTQLFSILDGIRQSASV